MNTITDREYAELRKLLAETDNLIAETRKMQSETQKQIEEREKLRAETRKMQSEILKLDVETKWHPLYKVAILWGSAFAAAAAVIKFSNAFLR